MQNKTAILERLKFFEKTLKNLRNVFVSLNFFFEHLHHFVIKQEFPTAGKVLALLVLSGTPTTLLDLPIQSPQTATETNHVISNPHKKHTKHAGIISLPQSQY